MILYEENIIMENITNSLIGIKQALDNQNETLLKINEAMPKPDG